jgi:hypothetical protein
MQLCLGAIVLGGPVWKATHNRKGAAVSAPAGAYLQDAGEDALILSVPLHIWIPLSPCTRHHWVSPSHTMLP